MGLIHHCNAEDIIPIKKRFSLLQLMQMIGFLLQQKSAYQETSFSKALHTSFEFENGHQNNHRTSCPYATTTTTFNATRACARYGKIQI